MYPLKQRWILYTVVVGSIPILVRLMLSLLFVHPYELELLSINDVAFYGLVLNITNLNKLELYTEDKVNSKWKSLTAFNSLLFILFFTIIFTLYFIDEASNGSILNGLSLKWISGSVSIFSLIYCFSVFTILSQIDNIYE